jgi:hypothetical protein
MTDNDLFESSADDQSPSPQATESPDHDFLAELVGDDKKFKDTQSLAKSVLHKDMHIQQIERENAELRQKIQQSLSLEEFYDKVRSEPSPSSPQGEPERTDFSIEQVGSLVDQRLQEHLNAKNQEANLAYAVNEAKKQLGSDFKRVLRARAQEVGESEADLTQLARQKPKLFLELMLPKAPTRSPDVPGLPRTQMDTAKMPVDPTGGVRNMSWYKKLKASDPVKYKDNRVQVQMHKDALALGEKFFQ